MVEPVHHGSSPRLSTSARIFLNLFQDLTCAILPVVGDVLVNSETPVVTSSISSISRLSLSEMLIRVGLRACIHRGECACVCERLRLYYVSQKKYVSSSKYIIAYRKQTILKHAYRASDLFIIPEIG